MVKLCTSLLVLTLAIMSSALPVALPITPGIHRYQEFSRREYLLDARDTYDVLDLEVRSGSKDAGSSESKPGKSDINRNLEEGRILPGPLTEEPEQIPEPQKPPQKHVKSNDKKLNVKEIKKALKPYNKRLPGPAPPEPPSNSENLKSKVQKLVDVKSNPLSNFSGYARGGLTGVP